MLSVIKKAGRIMGDGKLPNYSALAKAIGCHRSSLYTWKSVPPRFRQKIVDATNGSVSLKMLESTK